MEEFYIFVENNKNLVFFVTLLFVQLTYAFIKGLTGRS